MLYLKTIPIRCIQKGNNPGTMIQVPPVRRQCCAVNPAVSQWILTWILGSWVSMVPVEPLRDCPLIVVGHTAFLCSSVLLQFRCAPPFFHEKFCSHFWSFSHSLTVWGLPEWRSNPPQLSERRIVFLSPAWNLNIMLVRYRLGKISPELTFLY